MSPQFCSVGDSDGVETVRSPWRRPPRSGPARPRAPLSMEARPAAVQGQRLVALRHVEPPVGSIFCLTFMFQSWFFGLAGRPLTSVWFPSASASAASDLLGVSLPRNLMDSSSPHSTFFNGSGAILCVPSSSCVVSYSHQESCRIKDSESETREGTVTGNQEVQQILSDNHLTSQG